MTIADRIKIRADKIVKDMDGDIDAVARYAARLSLIYEIDEKVRIITFEECEQSDEKPVFDCEMCGAVPCGMGCHDNDPTD